MFGIVSTIYSVLEILEIVLKLVIKERGSALLGE